MGNCYDSMTKHIMAYSTDYLGKIRDAYRRCDAVDRVELKKYIVQQLKKIEQLMEKEN